MNYTKQLLQKRKRENIIEVLNMCGETLVALSIFIFAFILFTIIN